MGAFTLAQMTPCPGNGIINSGVNLILNGAITRPAASHILSPQSELTL
ncbi:hypothetical protein L579_1416 [Pantoea sp. AS-PWVM4]|nr:hypothetical protein L579_1416 [Pantoea sp. AS-PWVM4]